MPDQKQRKGVTYALATLGARTARGGYITRTSGDLKADPGYGQFAYMGSVLDNGDVITHSPDHKGGASRDSFEPVTEDQLRLRGELA